MRNSERVPSRKQISKFAERHGIPKRIAKLILKIKQPLGKTMR